ncbi:hypothetical protein PCYB_092500 [Plasmodium cynomolgi strain B]|uniref:Uncharacterized protein n=1 Tax=Plasmodium cynomolgi (strain B) TaxID=1120755 RepID=K6UT60_PLACD|nr:hypothetical protein PCYB_092500 [Plasmodium cynomolgi strain B]GAB66464.1 hypothetical protein PCYB_092500 [Plasmodium cynomolgi strain B]
MKGGGLGAILLPVLLLLSGQVKADYGIKTNKLTFLSQSEQCKKEISIYEEGNSFFIRNKDNTYLEVQEKVTVAGSLDVFGTVHTNEYRAFGQKQWTLHHLDTFDRKESAWIPSDISTCGNSPDTFLGGPWYGNKRVEESLFEANVQNGAEKGTQRSQIKLPCYAIFGAVEAYTTVRDIPKHSALKIKLRVHFFDAWKGDSLFLQADRKTVWAEQNWADITCNLYAKLVPPTLMQNHTNRTLKKRVLVTE